jgi:hypothetical protein
MPGRSRLRNGRRVTTVYFLIRKLVRYVKSRKQQQGA